MQKNIVDLHHYIWLYCHQMLICVLFLLKQMLHILAQCFLEFLLQNKSLVAEKLHFEEITALFVKDLTVTTKEDDLIKLLDSVSVGESDAMEQEEHAKHIEAVCATGYKRSTNGFITPVVGDVGTCKTNNAVMSRSNSYSWVGICLGDLHNKGSLV